MEAFKVHTNNITTIIIKILGDHIPRRFSSAIKTLTDASTVLAEKGGRDKTGDGWVGYEPFREDCMA